MTTGTWLEVLERRAASDQAIAAWAWGDGGLDFSQVDSNQFVGER